MANVPTPAEVIAVTPLLTCFSLVLRRLYAKYRDSAIMKLFLSLLLGFFALFSIDLRADATAAVSDAGKVALSLDGPWQSAQDLKDTGVNDSWFGPGQIPNRHREADPSAGIVARILYRRQLAP